MMKWVKAISFVLLCAVVVSVFMGVVGAPGELSFIVGVPVGNVVMTYAIYRWELI